VLQTWLMSISWLPMFAVLFLGISTFAEFLCVLLYAYLFPKLPIVKYYRSKAASEGSKTVSADLAAAGIQTPADHQVFPLFFFFGVHFLEKMTIISHIACCSRISSMALSKIYFLPFLQASDVAKSPERLSNKQLLFQNIDYALDLYLIYVLTLSIFPGFLYENTGEHQLGTW